MLNYTISWKENITAMIFNVCHEVCKGQSYNAAAAAGKSLQSCLTLCDPIDSSPPGSSVPGILQARILEWVAIFFSSQSYNIELLFTFLIVFLLECAVEFSGS